MSYFDKPERRAEWEKELSKLRAEKQARMNGEPVAERRGNFTERTAENSIEKSAEKGKPFREHISYVQLLREESMAKATVTKTVADKELQKEVSLEK